jgi:hypothetical protein
MAKRGRGFWSQQFTDEDYRQRLKSKCLVDPFTGCWIYQGFRTKLQYGDMSYRGTNWRAHRLAYTLWKGKIPEGLDILHKCDVPPCCNPNHLIAGTPKENAEDSRAKNRHYTSSKTHCVHGHEFAVHAYVRASDGRRICRLCERERHRRRYLGTPLRPTNAGKSHCIRGHELAGDNLYIKPNGERQCRTCRREVVKRIGNERSQSNGT